MFIVPIKKLFYKSPEAGAQTSILLAVEPELEKTTGLYFVGCLLKEPSDDSKDDETAEWLWEKSKEMTKFNVAA